MNGCHLAVKTALICWSKCQQAGTPVAAAALLARVHRSMRHERSITMQVSEAMSSDVNIANPQQTIREAAQMMAEIDAGALPVGENDRLVGMITDRDIAVRAVAAGKGPDTPIREIMSNEVKYCFEDDDLEEIAHNMADIKLRRLPVLNENKRLVGIISLCDIALAEGPDPAGQALCGISEPGGEHSQTMDGKGAVAH
jgi:CBS domain-containing protein